jgi:hypothetical protein
MERGETKALPFATTTAKGCGFVKAKRKIFAALQRGFGILPNKQFSSSRRKPETMKIRKWITTSYACKKRTPLFPVNGIATQKCDSGKWKKAQKNPTGLNPIERG